MNHLDLETLTLLAGKHNRRSDGLCLLEAVAWWAEEEHTDHPQCVSPVVAAFGRRWNDDLDDGGRQRLKPYIPRLVGTNTGPADDERRAWMVTDWMVRIHLPAWLRLAKLDEQATAVAALAELVDLQAWEAGSATVAEARTKAAAARAAAWDAARAAAGDAAWAAAGDAVWAAASDAAWDAAGTAAGTAAGDAARTAVGAAAWGAAGDAAWAAAGAAAGAAARAAARAAAWDAARAAAGEVLRPTVEELQASAFELLDRLIAVGKGDS